MVEEERREPPSVGESLFGRLRPVFQTLTDAGFAIAVATTFGVVHGYAMHRGYLAAFNVPSRLFQLSIADSLAKSVGTVSAFLAFVAWVLILFGIGWMFVIVRALRPPGRSRAAVVRLWLLRRRRRLASKAARHIRSGKHFEKRAARAERGLASVLRLLAITQVVGMIGLSWLVVTLVSFEMGEFAADFSRRDTARWFAGQKPSMFRIVTVTFRDDHEAIVKLPVFVIERSADLLAVYTLDGTLILPRERVLKLEVQYP